MFKVWNAERDIRTCSLAESLADIKDRGAAKLRYSRDGSLTLVLESDGCVVDEEDYFDCLESGTTFILLREGERWLSPDISFRSNTELQRIVDADPEALSRRLNNSVDGAIEIQDECQRYLDEARMASEAIEFITMLKDAHRAQKA